jgi:hypothetical protein
MLILRIALGLIALVTVAVVLTIPEEEMITQSPIIMPVQ